MKPLNWVETDTGCAAENGRYVIEQGTDRFHLHVAPAPTGLNTTTGTLSDCQARAQELHDRLAAKGDE